MSNNLFYKTLSIIGTLGIVVLSSTQLWITFKKQTDTEAEISKTLLELKQARKETLSEINLIKKEVLKELNSQSNTTLKDVKEARKETLRELNIVRQEALNEIQKMGGNEIENSVWLILHKGWGAEASLEKIPMKDMSQCELQGALWKSSKRLEKNLLTKQLGFECIEGK